tara:strand:- start:3384 stop:3659 length:276 start_codon:yes stop_codon:yes gene_type:complete
MTFMLLFFSSIRENRRALILGARNTAAKARAKLVAKLNPPLALGKSAEERGIEALESLQAKEVMKVFAQAEQRRRRAKTLAVSYTKREREV